MKTINVEELDIELIKKWITALESNEYKQGKYSLCKEAPPYDKQPKENKSNLCFCVMGVLCDIYDSTKWKQLKDDSCILPPVSSHESKFIHFSYLESFSYSFTFIPEYLLDKIGFTKNTEKELHRLNDSEGFSFKELATALRKFYRRLYNLEF